MARAKASKRKYIASRGFCQALAAGEAGVALPGMLLAAPAVPRRGRGTVIIVLVTIVVLLTTCAVAIALLA